MNIKENKQPKQNDIYRMKRQSVFLVSLRQSFQSHRYTKVTNEKARVSGGL